MIFRRLADGFRRQDWFTVGVELLIVVVGVYLGIFIGDVAEKRAVRADVDRTLNVLLLQLDEDLVNVDEIITHHLAGRESYQTAIDLLSVSPLDAEAFAEASRDAVLVHRSFFPNKSAYETIRQLGYLAEVRDTMLQLQIANLFERIYVRNVVSAAIMDEVAQHYQMSARDVYWNRARNRLIDNAPEGPVRMQNSLIFIRNSSIYYRWTLENNVRSEIVKTIDVLAGYLQGASE